MGALIFFLPVILALLALTIVAIVRTSRIEELEERLARMEAAAMRSPAPQPTSSTPAPAPQPPAAPSPPTPAPVTEPGFTLSESGPAEEHLESIIGRRWTGLIAIALIVVATAFFLKYAFESRWIGELGRVALGVAAGLTFVGGGYKLHRRRWRYLSEVLTGGGIVILYLSVYGAFAYYHLVDQPTAFVFLAILVAQAGLLALAYDAPSIAILALVGGLLVPLLLSTGRDQYGVLFTYIGILDLGMLGVVMARSWKWIGSLAYLGTQLLFWAWYSENYLPGKRLAALLFQSAAFLIFVCADLAPNVRRIAAGREEWIRLAVNPFVFYATCYALLNTQYHNRMAPLALLLAVVYAALACAERRLYPADRRVVLVTAGTALTFVTLSIPIQLDANWITIAWGLEALVLLWAAIETATRPLQLFSRVLFALAVARFLFLDTPWWFRPLFTPVFNRYFLGMLALTACLSAAAYLCRRVSGAAPMIVLAAFGVFWLGSSVEAYTYFAAQARAAWSTAEVETGRRLLWAGQLSLSLLWSVYAGLLTFAGFRFQLRALRVAGLVLCAITLAKALLIDISELRQFYRILALFVLGLVLLGVAWKYQRGLRRETTS